MEIGFFCLFYFSGFFGGGGAEEPGKAGVAPSASVDGLSRSEKAKVLEKGITGYSGAEKP
jgi:hypothetical protein